MKFISRVFLMMMVALLLTDAAAWAEGDASSHPAPPARMGDVVIRHRGDTLGCIGTRPGDPVIAIPHIGLFIGDRVTHNVVQVLNEHGQANIRPGFWQDRRDFQDGAFFSLLDSPIPVRYQGRIIPMRDLPGSVKDDTRGRVCNIAEVERTVLRHLGKYEFSQFNSSGHSRNCGNWVLGLYDRVFQSMGITVMSHNFPARRSPEEWLRNPGQLKPGHLQNYAEVLFGTVDPSRLAGWCPRVGPPGPATIPNYWVTPGTARSMTEANTLPAFAQGKHRALIVGDGKEAQHMYEATCRLLGPDNVKWIKPGGQPVDWMKAAWDFGAEVVYGEKRFAANPLQNYTGEFGEPNRIPKPVLQPQKETVSRQRNNLPLPLPSPPGIFAGPPRSSQSDRLPGAFQTRDPGQSTPPPANPASGYGRSGALPPQKASLGSTAPLQSQPGGIFGPYPPKAPPPPWELPGVRFPSGIGYGSVILSPPMMHAPPTSAPSLPSTRLH
jgi:hypothetical protein